MKWFDVKASNWCFTFLFLFLSFLAPNRSFAAEKELVVVFTGDTAGYVEPCG